MNALNETNAHCCGQDAERFVSNPINMIKFLAADDTTHEDSIGVALSGIQYPGVHDVLSGRGGHATTHPGNIKFRTLIDTFKKHYSQCTKHEKSKLVTRILTLWRGQNPPGRFLIKVDPLEDDSLWEDIGDKAAAKKIAQALRERRSIPMVPADGIIPLLPTDICNARLAEDLKGAERALFPLSFQGLQHQHQHQHAQSTEPMETQGNDKIRAIEQEILYLKQQNLQQQLLQLPVKVLPAVSEDDQAEPMDATPTLENNEPSPMASSDQTSSGKPPLPPLKPFPDREESDHFSQLFDSMMSDSGSGTSRSLKSSQGSQGSHERHKMMRDSIGSFSGSEHSSSTGR